MNNTNPLYLVEQLSKKTLLRILKDSGYKNAYKRLKGGFFSKGASEEEILGTIKNINRDRKISRIKELFRDQEPVKVPENLYRSGSGHGETTDYMIDVMKKRHPRSYFDDVVGKVFTGTKKTKDGFKPDVSIGKVDYIYPEGGGRATHALITPEVGNNLNGLRKHGFEFGHNWKRLKPNEPYDPRLDIDKLYETI